MNTRRSLAFLPWVAAAMASSAVADNWPSFRGPNGSGLGVGDPPTTWNVESGENIKWKTPIPGLAHSSPIVWGDRIFLTTAVALTGTPKLDTGWMHGSVISAVEEGEWEWRVLCLDRKTGKILWDKLAVKAVPKFKRHPKSSHASCTPATDGKRVVAFFGAEGMYAFDMDGKELWKVDLGPLNPAWMQPDLQWGHASSPILHEDKVILQCDSFGNAFWASFDANTGKEILRITRDEAPTWTTPSIYKGANGTQLVCNGYKRAAGYDLATGKELWWFKANGDIPVPRPIVAGDLFFITNGHGASPIYAVKATATGNITPTDDNTPDGLAWWSKTKGSYMPTPIVVGDVLYVGDDNGVLSAFDAKSGEKVYRERLPSSSGGGTYSASPVSAGGKLYFTAEDGQITVVKASRGFEVVDKNQMGEVCMATPAIADGRLLIRGRNHLYCIGK